MAISSTQELGLSEDQVSNGANDAIESGMPYRLLVGVVGTSDLLFHAWNIEAVAAKAVAAKGSRAKKTDDLASYAYKTHDGLLGIPGRNFAASIQISGKFMQDPRSPRKSALDLCKAGVIPLDDVSPFLPNTRSWDYEHAARVTIQRAGVTRIRPAMRAGWRTEFTLLITTPEYLRPDIMAHLISQAGRLVGVCDYRPTYGRFAVESMTVLPD